MKILIRKEDGLVISSFNDNTSVVYRRDCYAEPPIDMFFCGYHEHNSEIIEEVTLPEDYADIKYFYDSETQEWTENIHYPIFPEHAEEVAQAEALVEESAPE